MTRPHRATRISETAARVIFGICGSLVLGAYALALLYAPEIRHALAAWHH